MNGIQIQYLLGLYFLVISIEWTENKITANIVKLIAGTILVLAAAFGKSLI